MELGAKVRRALDSLRSLDLSTAQQELSALASRRPVTAGAADALALVERLHAAGDLDARTEALQSLRPGPRPQADDDEAAEEGPTLAELAWRAAAQGLAEKAEQERGRAGRAGGWPVARLYLEAGEGEAAARCAEEALRAQRSPALLTCLADATFLQGDDASRAEARDLYRQALTEDPAQVPLELVCDGEVRDLLSLAELQYEVPGEPRAWLVIVGFLEGVLPVPHIDEAEFARVGEAKLLEVPAESESPRAFYHYLRVSESHQFFGERGEALRLEARKRLKAISPSMYGHYLQRF